MTQTTMQKHEFQEISGGITAPTGFKAGGLFCGIRKARKDLALIVSEIPAVAAAVFTQNVLQAAPILVSKIQLKKSPYCSAVVVNSGNANACTGERGLNDAWAMAHATADALKIPSKDVIVSSTGVIGQNLPIEKILAGIYALEPLVTSEGSNSAAEAIMTTDTFSKQCAIEITLGGKIVKIGGIAKGSGMICPNMATMLAFITSDAKIPPELLNKALQSSNSRTFNRISVDGDMSTNDMALVLANGLAENPEIQSETPEFELFQAGLEFVLLKLAKMIARDGEGATKLIEISVTGAKTEIEAEKAGRAVANSNLVKTAMHGADANWGRILAAIGYSGIDFDPYNVELSFNDVPVIGRNFALVLDEEKAKKTLSGDEIIVHINLNRGNSSAKYWTCDLTKEYVHINASYRS